MLGLPCTPGDPQRQARGAKNQKWSPTKGNKIRSGCLNPAFSGAQKRARLLRHPCILGDPQRQARAAKKISSCPQQRGTKSEVAASPLPSRGRAQIPNAKAGSKKWKWGTKSEVAPHPCLLAKEGSRSGDPQRQARAAKNRNGPLQRGTKSEVAASTLPSRGPKRGQDCSVTPAFSGIPNAKRGEGKKSGVVPNKGEQNQKWLPHPCLLGGPKEGKIAPSPLHSWGSPTPSAGSKKSKMVPNKGEQNQKWLPHPCLLGGPKEGGNATSPLHSWGSPTPSAGSKK